MATVDGVTVKFVINEDSGKVCLKVQVKSVKKPGLSSDWETDFTECSSVQHAVQQIQLAGSAGAEYLGTKYGDNIDLEHAGVCALKAFKEECKQRRLLQSDSANKLKFLKEHQNLLTAQDQEILERIFFYAGKDLLLPGHIAWMDRAIQTINQRQV